MRPYRRGFLAALATAASGLGAPAAAEQAPSFDAARLHPAGAEIYRMQCAECHGAGGEGVAEEYDEPLYGDRSLAWLTRKIERTMPEDAEDECVGEDAAAVAAYIYDAFYSPEAQARLRPREIDPVRLTVAQHRNALADVIGRFRWEAEAWPEDPGRRGLEADYFETSKFRPDEERLKEDPDRGPGRFERIDPVVSFDFGEDSPDPGHFGSEEFSIRWSGALLAPETGTYEFHVSTRNGVRLYVNDRETPLIDGWVSSGGELREESASLTLLGGRVYPVRLEFFKFKDKAASVELKWKRPHGSLEIVPARVLAPIKAPESFAAATPFPPDDASRGYERGTAVSKAWFRAATDAAIEAAGYVVDHLEELADAKDDAPERAELLRAFGAAFVEAAFRRPLTDEQRQAIVDRRFEEADDPRQAVKRVVLFALTSPRFLYPERPGVETPDAFDVASRLSFALWDSIPDGKLLEAAAEGALLDAGRIQAETERMLGDPRARAKLRGFFLHWLEVEKVSEVVKDPELYPEFDEAILADLRTSLEVFIDDVVWSRGSDYRELLLADYLVLNERLGELYGAPVEGPPAPEAAVAAVGFQRVPFDGTSRVGVLTHPFLLSAFAYHRNSSPIHRGVFLTRNIVGRPLKPPPEAVEFKDSMFEPDLTMREKVTQLTRDAACMSCHSIINPLGFSLEHYDAIGRWRASDNGKPIDPASDYTTDDGEVVRLEGARDVAEFAVSSRDAHEAFVRQLFHHVVKQPDAAFTPGTVDRLRREFADSGFHIRNLAAEIAVVAAARGLDAGTPDVTQR